MTGPLEGRYRLAGEIGSGAIAVVHRVEDREAGVVLAGKVPHERHRRDPTAMQRFRLEAELAQRLRHPNVVAIHGLADLEGAPTLLMELVEGPTLAELIAREAPLDLGTIVSILRDLASGLAHAHAVGVIHRDLKPANVLLAPRGDGPPMAKVADFGMARATSFAAADRRALRVLGTPEYMAPESLDPLAVDPRADLYGLGCILHEMATGSPPYDGSTPFALIEAHRSADIPRLPDTFPRPLADLAQALLAKRPGDRPQSAGAVLQELEGLSSGALVPVGGGALVPTSLPDAVRAGRCVRCGADVVGGVALCFGCGLPQPTVEPGTSSVFITGPGRVSAKMDVERRQALIEWLEANPDLPLDWSALARTIPRLPFVFAMGLSPRSADSFVFTLRTLGLQAEARRGGRFALDAMLSKAGKLGVRAMTPAAALGGFLFMIPFFGWFLFPVVVPLLPVSFAAGAWRSGRPFARALRAGKSGRPEAIERRLTQIREAVPAIQEPRHREALRTVVSRVLALLDVVPLERTHDFVPELEHALNLALVAARRMDELDRLMAQPGFDASDPAQRDNLHERDTWAGRLLELTARLDALATRAAAAKALRGEARTHEELQELRASVEALEEVARLG